MIKERAGLGSDGDNEAGSLRIDIGNYDAATAAAQVKYQITGTSGNDTIVTGGKDDVITGGAGADNLTGGDGADTFVFSAGDSSVISDTVFDIVRDYTAGVGGDTLKLGNPVVQGDVGPVNVATALSNGGVGGEVVTASSVNGVITLAGTNAGSIDTLAEWLAVARLVVIEESKVAAFAFGGDTYVYQENTGGDLLIQLDNVAGITTLGLTAAVNTIVIA